MTSTAREMQASPLTHCLPRWEDIPVGGEIPLARSGHVAVTYKRQIYMFGGYDMMSVLPHMFAFDLDTHVWRRLDTAGREPQSRTSHAMALDEENGLIYLIAGSGPEFGFTNMNDIHEFNLHFNTWRELQFQPTHEQKLLEQRRPHLSFFGRYGHSAVFYKRCLYVWGGTAGQTFTDQLYCFDLDKGTRHLILTSDGPTARYKHVSEVIGHFMVVFGGADSETHRLNDFYLFDLLQHDWHRGWSRDACPFPGRFSLSISLVPSFQQPDVQNVDYIDYIDYKEPPRFALLCGGSDRQQLFNDVLLLDLATLSICELRIDPEHLLSQRYFHVSSWDERTNSLIVFGGKTSNDLQDRVNDVCGLRLDCIASVPSNLNSSGWYKPIVSGALRTQLGYIYPHSLAKFQASGLVNTEPRQTLVSTLLHAMMRPFVRGQTNSVVAEAAEEADAMESDSDSAFESVDDEDDVDEDDEQDEEDEDDDDDDDDDDDSGGSVRAPPKSLESVVIQPVVAQSSLNAVIQLDTVGPHFHVDQVNGCSLKRDMLAWFRSGRDADISVLCHDGVLVPAHRLMIWARCPSWRHLLSHEPDVKTNSALSPSHKRVCSQLDLGGLDDDESMAASSAHPASFSIDAGSDAIRSVLEYIYTDELPEISIEPADVSSSSQSVLDSRLRLPCLPLPDEVEVASKHLNRVTIQRHGNQTIVTHVPSSMENQHKLIREMNQALDARHEQCSQHLLHCAQHWLEVATVTANMPAFDTESMRRRRRLLAMCELRIQRFMSPKVADACKTYSDVLHACPSLERLVNDFVKERTKIVAESDQFDDAWEIVEVRSDTVVLNRIFADICKAQSRHAESMRQVSPQYVCTLIDPSTRDLGPVDLIGSSLGSDLLRMRFNHDQALDCPPFDFVFEFQQHNATVFKIRAHRALLSARSDLFGSHAFSRGMLESKSGVCQLPLSEEQISPQAFCILINYFYGGDVSLSTKITDLSAEISHRVQLSPKRRKSNNASPSPSHVFLESHLPLSTSIASECLARDVCTYFGLSSDHLARVCQHILRTDTK